VGLHADAVAHSVAGGIGAYVARLTAELLRNPDGVDLRLIVSRSSNGLPSSWPRERIVRSPLPLRAAYVAWNFARVPAVRGLDVVHAPGYVVPAARDARLVATVPDDTIERHPELVPAFWRTLYRRGLHVALREASVLCAISEATKRVLIDAHGVEADRVVVTPLAPLVAPGHAEDVSVFERHGIRVPYVLHVGTIEPRKNQAALVRAFAKAALHSHQLVLAGVPGWGSAQTDEAVAACDLSSRVVITGRVSDDELAALYAHAAAFAFPSVYEGFGMPLVEALGFGVPSVASQDAALREVAGGAAVHTDTGDAEAFAAALEAVCTDDALRARLAEAGPRRAAEYTWDRTARTTIAAWSSAVAAGAP
jgi:glycosyltransferase involved in cell wall biosynthesis